MSEGRASLVNLPPCLISSLSFPFMMSMVCDLLVRRLTPVLLIGLTPTDRRLTLEKVRADEAGNTCYPTGLTLPLSAQKNCGSGDRVIVDRQEHRSAKQSCCQSKEVESSSLEGKHRDGNSFTEPAGDNTGGGRGGQLSNAWCASSSSTSCSINTDDGDISESSI